MSVGVAVLKPQRSLLSGPPRQPSNPDALVVIPLSLKLLPWTVQYQSTTSAGAAAVLRPAAHFISTSSFQSSVRTGRDDRAGRLARLEFVFIIPALE